MKVLVDIVGAMNHARAVQWPEGWPIPQEGDSITIPGIPEVAMVRTIVWYPEGNDDPSDEDPEPFVYIVIGPSRRKFV